ncbi:MAG TPA: tyrosine-type recombinase/integrase [Verrucomicrobiae bacterium]|nr:tyrosine-type recombinase/integrase [Verrucomicrobiae bacterium]
MAHFLAPGVQFNIHPHNELGDNDVFYFDQRRSQKMSPDFFAELLRDADTTDMRFHDLAEQFYYDCKVRNLSPNTLRGYGERLMNFYLFLKVRKIRLEGVNRAVIQDYIMSLKDRVSDHTVNGRLRVLRVFFRFLAREGLSSNGNPMDKVSLIKTENTLKPILMPEQIEQLLSVPNKRIFTGYRNFAILLVFWDSLIRLSELTNLKIADVDLKQGLLKVYGKGRKERVVPVGTKTVRALHLYWVKYRQRIPGELFFCQKSGRMLERRNVERILTRIGERVKLHVTPHLIRHSAATWWIKQGAQPMYLQNLMGHTSMSVTQRYVHLASVDDLKKHHQKFSLADSLRI